MSTAKWKRPNVQKHGVFSATAILPGEDEEEFKELHTALIDEWRPVGATEEDAVLSIAKAVWRKRRVQKFLEVQLKQNTADPNHPAYQESVSLTALLVHMTNAPSEMPFGEYAPFYLRPNRIKFLQEKCPRGRFNSNSQWIEAIKNEIDALVQGSHYLGPEVKRIELLFNSATNFSSDLFKQELALDERLDAMIDRAVKRLIQMKAMKQMLGDASADQSAGQQKRIESKTAGK